MISSMPLIGFYSTFLYNKKILLYQSGANKKITNEIKVKQEHIERKKHQRMNPQAQDTVQHLSEEVLTLKTKLNWPSFREI